MPTNARSPGILLPWAEAALHPSVVAPRLGPGLFRHFNNVAVPEPAVGGVEMILTEAAAIQHVFAGFSRLGVAPGDLDAGKVGGGQHQFGLQENRTKTEGDFGTDQDEGSFRGRDGDSRSQGNEVGLTLDDDRDLARQTL